MSDLIDRQALRAAHGLGADCHDCKRDMKSCQYDRDYSLMDFCEWLDDAPTASPWRKVEDGLPDKYTQCLVADADGKCAVGYYRYDCGAWDSPAFGWVEAEDRMYIDYMPMGIGKVVAWMPIEPPKEDA